MAMLMKSKGVKLNEKKATFFSDRRKSIHTVFEQTIVVPINVCGKEKTS